MVESFDDPSMTWLSLNDPVMGGESTGAVGIEDKIGTFGGEVVNVPFFCSPVFVKIVESRPFPDASSAVDLAEALLPSWLLFASGSSPCRGNRNGLLGSQFNDGIVGIPYRRVELAGNFLSPWPRLRGFGERGRPDYV